MMKFNLAAYLIILTLLGTASASFAEEGGDQVEKEAYVCTLLIARENGTDKIYNIKEEAGKVFLGYNDPADPYDKQVVFTFPDAREEGLSSLGGRAVVARLLKTEDPEDPHLELGFYRSSADFGNYDISGLPTFKGGVESTGIMRVPDSGRVYTPIYVVSSKNFSFNGDAMIMFDDSGERRATELDVFGSKITGNNMYRNVELYCRRGES